MMTIYCEHANSRLEFWTYLENGRRWYVTERFARMEIANGTARLVELA